MVTQAYFTNIRSHITKELSSADSSIYTAVAWFTDVKLFNILCDKAQQGLDVQLIVVDDFITRGCKINYLDLEKYGGKVYLIDENKGALMHNKFCVIDEKVTITGSYNWSIKASANHENITISSDNTDLASSFIDEFRRIKIQYHGNDPLKKFDAAIISIRLTIIDNLIQLEEFDQIQIHQNKISDHELTVDIIKIQSSLDKLNYNDASLQIRDYLIRIKAITEYKDFDLDRIKWEIKYLEVEIVALENEKVSIEKIISDFVHSYNLRFGDLLLEILKLKKYRLQEIGNTEKAKEYAKAEENYNNFKYQYQQSKEEIKLELSEDEQKELKSKFRKAAFLCHPDVIANKFPDNPEILEKAKNIMQELNEAYNQNDLKKVSEILNNLENGIFDSSGTTSYNSKEKLLERLEYLKQKRSDITSQLEQIRKDKAYRDIISIKDLDKFYHEEQERLENELIHIKNEQH
jgi:hypothetical protein